MLSSHLTNTTGGGHHNIRGYVMKKAIVIVMMLLCPALFAEDAPSSTGKGSYQPEDAALLPMIFEDEAAFWLRRYEPTLVTKEDSYVKMTARYDYLCDIELFVDEGQYRIVVTIAEERYGKKRAQRVTDHLAEGIRSRVSRVLAMRR